MAKAPENEKFRTDKEKEYKFDVLECPEEDSDCNKSISCHQPSVFSKDSDDEIVSKEKDLTEDQEKKCEDVAECSPGRDDEDDNLGTEEENEDEDEETDELDEEKHSVDLTIQNEQMDTFWEEESKKNTNQTTEEERAVAEREPIVFGVISEFLPVCVVTLDIKTKGSTEPCYDLRELLKQRLWTQSAEVLNQLIILYNLFSTSDTRLQMIDCEGAVQLHVQVFSFNAIDNFVTEVQSGRFNDVLACMLISHHMQEKMKKLNAKINITCHCESLNQWNAEYENTLHSFDFYQRMPGPYETTSTVDWPSESSFSLVQTEIDKKLSIATVFDDHISKDFKWDEPISLEQRSKYGGGEPETGEFEGTILLAADDEPRSSSPASSKPLISRSISVDHPSSKCNSKSTSITENKPMRRKTL